MDYNDNQKKKASEFLISYNLNENKDKKIKESGNNNILRILF